MKSPKRLIVVAVVLAIGGGLAAYWRYTAAHPSTDDSYLEAGILTITPQVSGTVSALHVVENQLVQQGDILFTIDAAPLIAARDAALAQLDQASQAAGVTGANVFAAEAQLSSTKATQSEAQSAYDRQTALFKDGNVAQAAVDKARASLDETTAAVAAAEAALQAARAQSGLDGAENAGVRAARANLTLADINLARATIAAPASGWISNLDLRQGQFVAAGQPQFSIVDSSDWWVEANFKETDLALIRAGLPAEVAVDMYPGLVLPGVVQSIGAGSGATFSLLPAQNATGNWVKVTQRFPVRIALTSVPQDPAKQLRAGASATVTVDTTQAAGTDANEQR